VDSGDEDDPPIEQTQDVDEGYIATDDEETILPIDG